MYHGNNKLEFKDRKLLSGKLRHSMYPRIRANKKSPRFYGDLTYNNFQIITSLFPQLLRVFHGYVHSYHYVHADSTT